MWSIDVVTPDNDSRQFKTLHVRIYKHLSCGLTRSIGISRRENARLQQVVIVILHLAVYLIGGDMDKSVDTDLLCALEHDVGAIHIGVCEAIRVPKTQIYVRLGCEVEDGVYVEALHAVKHFGRVGDVAMVEGKVSLVIKHARVV